MYKDLIDASADNIEWLVDECGCQLDGLIDNYPCGATSGKVDSFHWWKDGAAYVGYVLPLQQQLRDAGADIRLNNRALEFSYDESGKVNGVYAIDAFGDLVQYEAKFVVLATGGYSRNAELAMEYDKRVTKDMPSSNVCSSTGDGLGLGEGVGAGLRNMELVQIHPLGDPQNGGVATFVGNWLGVEDYVMVNDEGKRFIREDERRDTIADAILEQPNDEMWLLVDSTDIAADRADQIAELVEKGHSFKADGIEDLANQIGVPADALAETVEGYNACVKAGVDTQIAPGKELLGTELSDPAYYASKRIPTIHYTMGGLCITTDAQVCTEAGEPIPNLFACGEVTGGVQGGNRLGGNSFTDLIVFGRIAGASAVANA